MQSESMKRLPRGRRAALVLSPVAAVVLAWGVPVALKSYYVPPPAPVAVQPETDGLKVYAEHCAYCHGAKGDGQGTALLSPLARYFGRDKFKFATTKNGVPTDDDLLHVLKRGIPGSAMPSFEHLPEESLRACVRQVREFARKGIYDGLVQKALKTDDEPDPQKFSLTAATRSVPGEPLEIPPFPPSSPEAVQRGREHYVKYCAACHGPEGKGDGPQVKDLKNDDGSPNVPRDLTKGLYKAGGEPQDLYARIALGIPGTPMPASDKLTPAEMVDLVYYVKSLVK